jgi:translation initiation factor IF-1
MQPTNHTPGKVRYLTIWIIFPGDNDRWVDQVAFAQPLDNFLKNTKLHPNIKGDLIRRGESLEQTKNGMKHLYVIEDKERKRIWGLTKDDKKPGLFTK